MKNKYIFNVFYFLYSLYPIFLIVNFFRYFGRDISIYSHVFKSRIHKTSHVRGKCFLENVVIGEESYISGDMLGFNHTMIRDTIIGKYCSIGPNLTTLPHSHPATNASTYPFYSANEEVVITRKIIIQNDVWIGANVLILGGVTIESGAIIGAGSVVTKDVPAYTIYAGNPAKKIKKRFTNQEIKKILKVEWWDNPNLIKKIRKSNRLETIINN